jgi:hypothetical protein
MCGPILLLGDLANTAPEALRVALPLVRALLVGATGFEPVTPSVSDPTSHYRRVQRMFKKREGWSESSS